MHMLEPPSGGLILGGCPENFGGVNTPPMGGVDNSLSLAVQLQAYILTDI